jgi:hypothetical protein
VAAAGTGTNTALMLQVAWLHRKPSQNLRSPPPQPGSVGECGPRYRRRAVCADRAGVARAGHGCRPSRVTLYMLRGRLDDGISWEEIGHPYVDLSACKADADRYTEHYSCVVVLNKTTGRIEYQATQRPRS